MTDHTVQLANGVLMPAFGLGTSPMDDGQAERAVARAIEAGYRLIDTAEKYGNEHGIGRGIRAGGVDRARVFVTTKFNAEWHSVPGARTACGNALGRLGLDYLDLLLIHWPVPAQGRYVDAWEGLIALLDEGLLRAAGVSNFKPAHLQRLVDATGRAPHVNQIQLNPTMARAAERAFHEAHDIRTMSWMPLGGAGGDLLDAEPIRGIAAAHGRSPAQVVLRWHVQLGLVPVPKSVHRERMVENLAVFDFTLGDDEMKELSTLDGTGEEPYDSDVIGN
ncbi:MAG TPA: aldo/keto reductase [Actinomycetota bacterium]|jgi:2,5-diketo-D-gluconate reductase A